MKNFRFQYKKYFKNEGFITLEIIVAILVAMGFLAVAMQSLVYAMAIKIQAQEKQRASQLINEDLEMANELANRSDLTVSSPVAGSRPQCNTDDYEEGYGQALWEALDTGGTQTKDLSDNGARQVALERTPVSDGDSDPPHRTLKIKYQVWHWDGTNYLDKAGNVKDAADEPIAETYVEIIPDVALACP